MNEAKEFLNILGKDPKAKELLKAAKKPANAEEAAQEYAIIANQLGFHVSKEQLLTLLNAKEKHQMEITARAEEKLDKAAISEDELDNVAGGEKTLSVCESSFKRGEWCWLNDSCEFVVSLYYADDGVPACDEAVLVRQNGYEVCLNGVFDGWGI